MKLSRLFLFAVLGSVLHGSLAQAGYQFQFADSSGNATTSFSVNEGSTVDIRVYLFQSSPDTGLSSGNGLNSGAVGVTFGNAAAARVQGVGDITPNTGSNAGSTPFDGSFRSLDVGGSTTTAVASVYMNTAGTGVTAPTTGADANRILLGTFKFTGVTAGDSSTLTVDPNPTEGFDDNVLANGTVLDSLINPQTAVITVTAVPEPSSLLLAGLPLVSFAAAALRRRFCRKMVPPATAA